MAPGQLTPVSSGGPSISGTPIQNQRLLANAGSWNGPSATYAYQWARCDGGGSSCSVITAATEQSYLLTATDVGTTMRSIVTANNKNGSTVATSPATSVIAPLAAPTSSSTTTAPSSTTSSAASSTTTARTTTPTTSTPTTTAAATTTTTTTPTTSPTTTTPTPSGTIKFNGNFETGNYSQWTWNAQCANTGTVSDSISTRGNFYAVQDVVAQGAYAGRFDLPSSSIKSACEVLRQRTLSLNTDDFYALDVRFPNNWVEPGGWGMTIAQFNFQNVWAGPLQLVAHADNVRVILQTGACVSGSGCAYNNGGSPTGGVPTAYAVPPGRLTLGVWHQLIVHVHWASDSSGLVETWGRVKGGTTWTKTTTLAGFPTVQWSPGTSPSTTQATADKEGAYRGPSTVPLSIWHDGFCVATTFSAAASCL